MRGEGTLTLRPIGYARSPFSDRASAPRQGSAAPAAAGVIELEAGRGFEDALHDVEAWGRIWVVFWFHLNEGWRPKVLPPRSAGGKKGVFATRSPYRPNPIGLTSVRLERVVGLALHVRELDLLDGTPVLDIKPYVPYADAFPDAASGWLEGASDPAPAYEIIWGQRAAEQVTLLRERYGVDLVGPVERVLALGPQPHAYRRITRDGDRSRLAFKEWRVWFRPEGRVLRVDEIGSGYRPSQLALDVRAELDPHRALVAMRARG